MDKMPMEQATKNLLQQKVLDFFGNDLSSHNLETREGQDDMALDINDAILNRKHYLVEAGVGIGKSFAYIVPILYYHHQFKRPIAIATSTITLQEQLISDITRISDEVHYKPEIVFAKGQTNFICRSRAEEYLDGKKGDNYDEIRNAISRGLQEINYFSGIDKATCESIIIRGYGNKFCKGCKFLLQCKFKQLRERMKYSNGIIVCNQDLLTKHLDNTIKGHGSFLNKDISVIVVDEAHNLENKVRDSVTDRCSKKQISRTLVNLKKTIKNEEYLRDFERHYQHIPDGIEALFRILSNQIQKQIDDPNHDMRNADRFFLDLDDRIKNEAESLLGAFENVYDVADMYMGSLQRENDMLSEGIDSLDSIRDFLDLLIHQNNNYLSWLEVAHNKHIDIVLCPKHTKGIINSLYFSNKNISSVICVSATLTNRNTGKSNDKYSYFIDNTGFPAESNGDEYIADPIASPFPYDKHAMLYFNDDLPHPTKEHLSFLPLATELVANILEITAGRGLVLFTAKTDLEEVYELLKKLDLPYRILAQGKNSSQKEILKEFRSDIHSVLLGTGLFWEGIDIRGESLSNVIIFRLPFPIQDPVISYKRSVASQNGHGALMSVDVPEMIIKLKQGIGRLIRSSSDKGIISIIDPRLGPKFDSKYKETVWDSLPIKNRTSDIGELKRFYENLPTIPEQKYESTIVSPENLDDLENHLLNNEDDDSAFEESDKYVGLGEIFDTETELRDSQIEYDNLHYNVTNPPGTNKSGY
jgi:ATP-dependent DNA helicase DinG